jgi:hypothetical protein
MAAALKRAGFDETNVLYQAASVALSENGGDFTRAVSDLMMNSAHPRAALRLVLRIVNDDMKGLRGEGQFRYADIGQTDRANPTHGGHSLPASDGQTVRAANSEERQEGRTGNGREHSAPSQNSETTNGAGHAPPAEAKRTAPPVRGRTPGAGALQARAYETRATVRGESWLLSYCIPDGPRLLGLTRGELLPMAKRMAREAGHRGHAAVLLRALDSECTKLGKVSPDTVIEKILPPAVINRLTEELNADVVVAAGRDFFRSYANDKIPTLENANG